MNPNMKKRSKHDGICQSEKHLDRVCGIFFRLKSRWFFTMSEPEKVKAYEKEYF